MLFKTLAGVAAPLALLAAPMPVHANAATPAGSRPNDRTMTCEDIAAERAATAATLAKKEERKIASAKVKRGLFGFARTFAGLAVPGLGMLGGASGFAGLAAQSAGQAALGTVGNVARPQAEGIPAPAQAPALDAEQQARADRLDRIAAFRQCA